MNRRLFLQALCGSLPALYLRSAVSQDSALFAQSASAALDRQFGSGAENLSWLLMDSSMRILARRWLDEKRPVPPGSLFKPFLALAYGEQNDAIFPLVHCSGTCDRCWLPGGHGHLSVEDAIAHSCNAYFLSLAARLDVDKAILTFRGLGLTGPPPNATPSALIGLTGEWRETSLALAQSYLTLLQIRQPARDRIARGMQLSAQAGTASAVGIVTHSALAKTGTSLCTHRPQATADGFTVVLYPAEQPRALLLLRMHAATGAQSSAQAAAMLTVLGFATA